MIDISATLVRLISIGHVDRIAYGGNYREKSCSLHKYPTCFLHATFASQNSQAMAHLSQIYRVTYSVLLVLRTNQERRGIQRKNMSQ